MHGETYMKRKRALIVASTASMIEQFNIPNIKLLISLGYDVDVITDFEHPGTISIKRSKELMSILQEMGVHYKNVEIPRKIKIGTICHAYRKIKNEIDTNNYTLIHCHSPIGAAITRLSAREARKKGTIVIYTAHGFHFFRGAPIKNWLLYYPAERILSAFTDILITINKEDFDRAKRKFKIRKIYYIPGIGVPIDKFATCLIDKQEKRRTLGIDLDAFVFLSVGELSTRKNQKQIIEALKYLKGKNELQNICYIAVGNGDKKREFEELVKAYHLDNAVKFLGYRTDIDELCEVADCFIHPSIREGLGIAPLEAMASGLPLISSNVNGIKDYTEDGVTGCCIDPYSVSEMADAMKKMISDEKFRKSCGRNNYNIAKNFDVKKTNLIMENIYKSGGYSHLHRFMIRYKVRQQLDIDPNAFVIISVGELNDNKNHQVIIKALNGINSKRILYVIVGIGSKTIKLKELAEQYGVSSCVRFLGYRKDILELLYASDCFAFPSKREGLGIAAVEALAAGLPLITSNSGGIKDYNINGKTGYICKSNSDKEYTELFNQLIETNEIDLINIKQYSLSFGEDKTIAIMNSIYSSI